MQWDSVTLRNELVCDIETHTHIEDELEVEDEGMSSKASTELKVST